MCTFAIRGKTVQKQAEIGEMELQDVAAIVLDALGIEQPDNYTARIPTGIYEGRGGGERPTGADPADGTESAHKIISTPPKQFSESLKKS